MCALWDQHHSTMRNNEHISEKAKIYVMLYLHRVVWWGFQDHKGMDLYVHCVTVDCNNQQQIQSSLPHKV